MLAHTGVRVAFAPMGTGPSMLRLAKAAQTATLAVVVVGAIWILGYGDSINPSPKVEAERAAARLQDWLDERSAGHVESCEGLRSSLDAYGAPGWWSCRVDGRSHCVLIFDDEVTDLNVMSRDECVRTLND